MKTHKKIIYTAIAVITTVLIILAVTQLVSIRRIVYPYKYVDVVYKYSEEYDLDPNLVFAVIYAESGFRSDVISHKGAVGLMQVMPDTGEWIAGSKLGIADFDTDMLLEPETNVKIGCWYLNFMFERFGADTAAVIAGYNAGHGRVGEWLESDEYTLNGKLVRIPYEETEKYVEKVLEAQKEYRELYPIISG